MGATRQVESDLERAASERRCSEAALISFHSALRVTPARGSPEQFI
jgi:hypothetical protein